MRYQAEYLINQINGTEERLYGSKFYAISKIFNSNSHVKWAWVFSKKNVGRVEFGWVMHGLKTTGIRFLNNFQFKKPVFEILLTFPQT